MSLARRLYIKTYGCQMNVYDSGRIIDILKPLGYQLTCEPGDADLVILNTCHIREKAEEKLFSELGRLSQIKVAKAKKGERMTVAVAGCVAQAQGTEVIRRSPAVDLVFGPQVYHQLPAMLRQVVHMAQAQEQEDPDYEAVFLDFPEESKFDYLPSNSVAGSPSAFVSIQEGCDKFCTFCVVPYTRGPEFSRPVTQVLDEVRHLVQAGTREITLLGQNVNAYHGQSPTENGTWGLGALIQELGHIEGLARIRYMTSHPRDMDSELIAAHRDVPACMPFLHLPVQSGSDKILKAMNRRHTVEFYLEIINDIRTARPDIALASDFIVGFPGETDSDFEETLDLVKTVGYSQAYTFKYSPRPGTPGSLRSNPVDEPIKDMRLQQLQTLVNQQQADFNKKSLETTVPILIERMGKKSGKWIGRTPYMQAVHLASDADLMGALVNVFISEAFSKSLLGTLLQKE